MATPVDQRRAGPDQGKEVRTILSIDGGGIRGIIPALVLAEIERRTGRPIAELFGLVAGTSTGGILAVGLTVPGPDGGPKFRSEDMVQLYAQHGEEIFHREEWRQALAWVRGPAYSPAALERLLAQYLGEAMLSQAVTGLLVTSWELRSRTAWFFRRAQARSDPTKDILLRDIARATSAAPTYFPPLRRPAPDGSGDYALVDGGVFANNPGMAAWVDAHEGARPGQGVFMLSLGTGSADDPVTYAQASRWGKISWAQPVINVVLAGAADTVEHELGQLLQPGHYHRFQTPIPRANRQMDDASPANLQALEELAAAMIRARSADIDTVCARLLELAGEGSLTASHHNSGNV
jgi:patatin-like phospholipase/acyl hydrolase